MSPSGPTLPEGSRLIHIGPHKTGSATVQAVLQEARPQLAGLRVVQASGSGHGPDKAGRALGSRGRPAGSEQPPTTHGEALVRDLRSGTGHVAGGVRRVDRQLPSQSPERDA